MTEIIFVLAATALVFALFFLTFLIRGRSDTDDAPRPTCARCDCHRSQDQRKRPLGHLKQIEKDIRP